LTMAGCARPLAAMPTAKKFLPAGGFPGLPSRFLPSLQLGLWRRRLSALTAQGKRNTQQDHATLEFSGLHHGTDLSWHLPSKIKGRN